MRWFVLAAVAALTGATWVQAAELCSHAHSAAKRSAPIPSYLRPLETWDATDVLRNDVDIDVTHATSTIAGSNTFTIRAIEQGLSEFTFRLADTFTISEVRVNGTLATFTRLDPANVRVQLGQSFNSGAQFTLKVTYAGPATAGAGFGSISFTTQNGQPLVCTLSEPYYSYTWWPNKDDNTDKALNSLAVTVPNGMKVAANGVLQSTTPVGATKTKWSYRCDYPMVDYLLFFSTTNYNQWTRTAPLLSGQNMLYNFMIYPASDNATNRANWEKVIQMIPVFESKYGPYPFRNEQYGIYQFAFGGGMEHQTWSGQGGTGFTGESLSAHELGHQWWGDMVTCGTWGDIWLNEGFATYSEALWAELKPGSTGLAALKSAMSSRKPTADTGTVFRYDTSSTGAIFSSNYAYRKGAWVLHMLRKILGDSQFFQALAAYRAAHEGGAATTPDFVAIVEQVAGRDMDWFFNPWIYDPGAVSYRSSSTMTTANGRSYLLVKLEQTQSTTYPTYNMPVDLRYTVGGNAITTTVQNEARTEHYVIPVSGTATGLTVDPDGWILTRTLAAGTFTAGPPAIVQVSPTPGNANDMDWGVFTVTFHTPVTCAATDFELKTTSGINVPFTFWYSSTTQTATILPIIDLAADGMRLTVKDTIKAVNSNLALDGEVQGPTYAIPSGNGQPGGAAVFTFGN